MPPRTELNSTVTYFRSQERAHSRSQECAQKYRATASARTALRKSYDRCETARRLSQFFLIRAAHRIALGAEEGEGEGVGTDPAGCGCAWGAFFPATARAIGTPGPDGPMIPGMGMAPAPFLVATGPLGIETFDPSCALVGTEAARENSATPINFIEPRRLSNIVSCSCRCSPTPERLVKAFGGENESSIFCGMSRHPQFFSDSKGRRRTQDVGNSTATCACRARAARCMRSVSLAN